MPDKKKKSEVRESKPLGETPNYNMDASELASKFKKIQADSAARRAASYANRKKPSNSKGKKPSNSKGKQSGGGSLQGLNTSLGGKIVR
jgi:hypothetical protein